MQEAGKGCKKQKLGGDIALLHRKVLLIQGLMHKKFYVTCSIKIRELVI